MALQTAASAGERAPEPAAPLPPNVRTDQPIVSARGASRRSGQQRRSFVVLIPPVQRAFRNHTHTVILNVAPEGKQSKGKIKASITVTFCILGKAVCPHALKNVLSGVSPLHVPGKVKRKKENTKAKKS